MGSKKGGDAYTRPGPNEKRKAVVSRCGKTIEDERLQKTPDHEGENDRTITKGDNAEQGVDGPRLEGQGGEGDVQGHKRTSPLAGTSVREHVVTKHPRDETDPRRKKLMP